ncbi:MbnP family protein [Polaribacter porphyrae]|uniref:Copper-binding protein MbnP-like domain-containing protein n=1 Tax=Polaribacter porphyrae TaxID=1137780 RepID=A0A2S7WRC9_9FLAO|nr:MbnP family protein [Polaribacter porphyrae]PQJ80160.1 hypothetical protein BTO18_13680 [Polaribacter porphyrae]
MKKILLLICLSFLLIECNSTDDVEVEKISVSLQFEHFWLASPLTASDLDTFKFETKNGDFLKIERLRYLLSNIYLINDNETFTFSDYTLIDLEKDDNFTLQLSEKIVPGSYQLKFRFGFKDDDNIDGAYQDLNTVNFNVPSMLGGGYHYMQFDGKYKDNNNQDANFNYHAIRAVDRSDPNNLVYEDTSFEVDLGTLSFISNSEITVKVNIAEWFRNPHTWDLNQLNTVLMPNFEAQKLMSANGKTVFSLGDIN